LRVALQNVMHTASRICDMTVFRTWVEDFVTIRASRSVKRNIGY